MAEGNLLMSRKAIERLKVMEGIKEKRVKQKGAAITLNITERQVRRVYKQYKEDGAAGITSKHIGAKSNRKTPKRKKDKIVSIIRKRYSDFGPTLAVEKLKEIEGIAVSRETARQWMIEEGIWETKSRKTRKVFQMRERRPRFGEMVQIDGSPHEWFEKRRSSCNLTVYVDDATGEFMELWFSEAETTEAYMETTLNYLVEYGLPRAFYSDKHSIFRVNQKDTVSRTELTQFGRALKTLGIELISAQTPQAKGRVERANKLLQDRLVKELRLRKINTIAEANDFLVEYKYELNKKFSVTARSPENGHRKVLHSPEELNRIFSLHHERTLSKNLSLQYDNTIYQIQTEGRGLTMRNAKATEIGRAHV